MNFERNENQNMIAQMVRDFAEKEIRPNMKKWDDDEIFPVETMKKMGDLGLLGIFIPLNKVIIVNVAGISCKKIPKIKAKLAW